eukprot:3460071-Rhodomonas_salina.1
METREPSSRGRQKSAAAPASGVCRAKCTGKLVILCERVGAGCEARIPQALRLSVVSCQVWQLQEGFDQGEGLLQQR